MKNPLLLFSLVIFFFFKKIVIFFFLIYLPSPTHTFLYIIVNPITSQNHYASSAFPSSRAHHNGSCSLLEAHSS